jgi:catechol 2,3-dioxygenase-like lactoylglutathione lyase family enzyme
MLALNHANLPVADVPALRDFFVRHFGFAVQNEGSSDAFAILKGDGGFILNIMKKGASDAGAFPRNFHVGFLVDSPEGVHETHARLAAAGVELGQVEDNARRGYSSVTFFCTAPNGILVEVAHNR